MLKWGSLMNVKDFIEAIGADFFTGVPDSQLRGLCDYLYDIYGLDPKHHIIAANEGNSVGIAAGYYMATGKIPVVYMQNSGEGNIVNPVVSLLNEKVYGIPVVFIIGWRGEPGVKDEPQHSFQGEITLKLLDVIGIEYKIISPDMRKEDVEDIMKHFNALLVSGKSVAFVVKKNALQYEKNIKYKNRNLLRREEIIKKILQVSGGDPVISTTGKASRELFEIRELNGQGHNKDFLTIGSMGHSSSIALGIALQQPGKRVWCIDGDGALLMHMGAMAVIGAQKPHNFIHILINNEAHETVGGMPTVMGQVDICSMARSCGYERCFSVFDKERLEWVLEEMKKERKLSFIEVKSSLGAREDLSRPTTKALDNKRIFMEMLMDKR